MYLLTYLLIHSVHCSSFVFDPDSLSACLTVTLSVFMSVCVCKEFEGKSLLYTWIYGVIIDRLYDVFIGVYVMVWIGGHRFTVSFTIYCVCVCLLYLSVCLSVCSCDGLDWWTQIHCKFYYLLCLSVCFSVCLFIGVCVTWYQLVYHLDVTWYQLMVWSKTEIVVGLYYNVVYWLCLWVMSNCCALQDVIYVIPESIVIAVYWLTSSIIMVISYTADD